MTSIWESISTGADARECGAPENISLLHYPDKRMAIAPAYDVVPQVHGDNDGRVALAINGKYDHRSITLNDLKSEVHGWGTAMADELINETVETVAEVAATSNPDARAYANLQRDILRFTSNLLAGRGAGVD